MQASVLILIVINAKNKIKTLEVNKNVDY